MDDIDLESLKHFLTLPGSEFHNLSEGQYRRFAMLGCLEFVNKDVQNAAPIYVETILNNPFPEVVSSAHARLVALASEGNLFAIKGLYHLAIEFDHLESINAIIAKKILPPSPFIHQLFDLLYTSPSEAEFNPDLFSLLEGYIDASRDLKNRLLNAAQGKGFINWAEICRNLEQLDSDRKAILLNKFPSYTEEEQNIILKWIDLHDETDSQLKHDLIIEIFIHYESITAKNIALSRRFSHQNPVWTALFFFLSDQWEQYHQIDFDNRFIQSIFLSAERNLRLRILSHSREHGYLDWMKAIQSSTQVRWVEDLSDRDWENTITSLSNQNRYSDLFRLAIQAPAIWGGRILKTLQLSNWRPEAEIDNLLFINLSKKANDCLNSFIQIRPSSPLGSTSNPLSSTHLDVNNKYFVAGGESGTIAVYEVGDIKFGSPQILTSPVGNIRCLAIDSHGEYLATAASDHKIRIYRLKDGRIIKTLEGHSGMVRSIIISRDSKYLYSCSFDGTIRVWNFPQGSLSRIIRENDTELFTSIVSEEDMLLIVAGSKPEIEIWNIGTSQKVRELQGHQGAILALTKTFSGDLIASSGSDHTINIWNFKTGYLVRSILDNKETYTHISMHPSGKYLFYSGTSGNISILDISTEQVIDSFYANHSPCCGLYISNDGSKLFSANTNGLLYSWDLHGYFLPRFPINRFSRKWKEEVKTRIASKSISPAELLWSNYIMTILDHRTQFDIQLNERETISLGEFDIEL